MKIKNCKNVWIYPSITEWREMEYESIAGDICPSSNVLDDECQTEKSDFDNPLGSHSGAKRGKGRRKNG